MCEILQTQEIVSETEGGKGAEEDQPKSPRTSDLLFPHRVKTGIEFIKLSLIPSHPCLPASPLRFGMKVRRRKKKRGGRRTERRGQGSRGKGAMGSYLFKTVTEPKVKEQRHEVQRWTEGKGGDVGSVRLLLRNASLNHKSVHLH